METSESLYKKVNAVFDEREKILIKRESDLNICREELLKIQANIEFEKGGIEQERKGLELEKAKLLEERKSIENQMQELQKQQDSVSGILEEIIQEKIQLQSLKNERLKQEVSQEAMLLQQTKEALGGQEPEETVHKDAPEKTEVMPEKDNRSGMSLSCVENSLLEKDENLIVSDPKGEMVKEAATSNPDEEVIDIVQKDSDSLIQQYAKESKEIFPDGKQLESTNELFCIAVADKELRIMLQNPPVAMILAKRVKDRNLIKGINQLNSTQSEWEFDYQDNCLRCMMPFTTTIPAEVILQKCADAMERYFL